MSFLDPKSLIEHFGTIGLIIIIFIESGILPIPLPGDSLLFIAGFFASTKAGGTAPHMSGGIAAVLIGTLIAAFVGAQVGYLVGAQWGDKIFKPDAKLFKTKYLDQAHEYFEHRGTPSVVLGRFIPVLRTIVPIVAGTTKMKARSFTTANAIGAVIWTTGITLLGYFAGDAIGQDNIDKYLLPIVVVIIVISLIPAFIEFRRHRANQH